MKPLAGNKLFNALKETNTILMAANTRIIPGVTKGIFKAAKEADAAFIIELAKSECDLKGGYTGLTPKMLAEKTIEIAEEINFNEWVLHADHITVKSDSKEEIEKIKELVNAQIEAGFTSFAVDASFLFNHKGKTIEECLEKNINVTIEVAEYIKEKMNGKEFGLEVEVGEIGYKDETGLVKTSPEEAVAFIKALDNAGVKPNVLAIANGSAHGNLYDSHGNLMPQLSIDVKQTQAVADALKEKGFNVKIAQHGITGTPREFIKTLFPKSAVLKGNVGTFWQNLVWDTLKVYEPELYKKIYDWTLKEFKDEADKKNLITEKQIFGTYSKKAIKEFFNELYSMRKETVNAIEAKAYAEALMFFEAFDAYGSAKKVREYQT